jgi:serine/threonine protein kinase
MGAVYKARDHRLDRLVAIKVLSEKAAATPERQARFIQEAKTAPAREDSRLPAQRNSLPKRAAAWHTNPPTAQPSSIPEPRCLRRRLQGRYPGAPSAGG